MYLLKMETVLMRAVRPEPKSKGVGRYIKTMMLKSSVELRGAAELGDNQLSHYVLIFHPLSTYKY